MSQIPKRDPHLMKRGALVRRPRQLLPGARRAGRQPQRRRRHTVVRGAHRRRVRQRGPHVHRKPRQVVVLQEHRLRPRQGGAHLPRQEIVAEVHRRARPRRRLRHAPRNAGPEEGLWDGPTELVRAEVHVGELREGVQAVDWTAEAVSRKGDVPESNWEPRREVAGEGVYAEVEVEELVGEEVGDLAGEHVGGEDEDLEAARGGDRRRDAAGELVTAEVKGVEAGELEDPGRDLAGEAVSGEGDDPEAAEGGELGGDGAGDDSGEEDELGEAGEAGDGGGEGAREAGGAGEAGTEREDGDAAGGGRAGDAGEGSAGVGGGGGEVPGGEEAGGGGDLSEGVPDLEEGGEVDWVHGGRVSHGEENDTERRQLVSERERRKIADSCPGETNPVRELKAKLWPGATTRVARSMSHAKRREAKRAADNDWAMTRWPGPTNEGDARRGGSIL
ncbi:collagen-like protein 7 [Striga asiatica]|uniref:Collagen-like protein 7 n=1 Tax=Striga asiatica TaxID=4170 RepID=A0A5A7QTM3_STRAF|nr:collagen-like protein 7 [Striga asiatica]